MNKKILFAFSLFFFILGIVLSHTYRPIIYRNGIFDFHLADTIGSLVAVPSSTCLGLIFYSQQKLHKIVGASVASYILFEMFGLFNLHGIFDIYDIIATIVSGIITYVIIYKVMRNKEIDKSKLN